MKKILFFVTVVFVFLKTIPAQSESPIDWAAVGGCNLGGSKWFMGSMTRYINGQSHTLECKNGKLYVQCSTQSNIPDCSGKDSELLELGDSRGGGFQKLQEIEKNLKSGTDSTSKSPATEASGATTSTKPAQTTPPDAGKILDDKTESGKKTDLSSQSVTGSTKQPTIDGTAAMQNETGKPTSGNVEKPSFVGSSNLSSEYYGSDKCGGGNIFQQLACRAGTIGSGLKTAGYMIAGFGLIVFAFAAIFGKVKWPLFATIAFSCFLLSITMAVINMMTEDGKQWMGDVSGAGSISTSATDQPKGNTDANEVSKDKS